MVYQKILGDIFVVSSVLIYKLVLYQLFQIVFKIAEKKFTAFTGKEFQNVILIFLQVLQQVTEYRFLYSIIRI